MNQVIEIFITFMKIGAFGFGGGLAMLPLIEKEIVHNNGWITSKELVDIIAIVEMTPGPIAVNSSTFVGYKVAGIFGALAGSIGVIIISFTLMTLLAKYMKKMRDMYQIKTIFKGIRPAILGLILSAVITIGRTSIVDIKSILIATVVFIGLYKFKIHPIGGIVLAGILGFLLYI